MVKRGVSQLIDALESRVFDRIEQTPKEKEAGAESARGDYYWNFRNHVR